jgi:hypothetical protein
VPVFHLFTADGLTASKDNLHLKAVLTQYHRRNITNAEVIRNLLQVEHGITIRYVDCISVPSATQLLPTSAITIKRRRKAYGLMASGATTRSLPAAVKEQLIFDQLANDPLSRLGPRSVKEHIALDSGIHLTRFIYASIDAFAC